MIRESTAWENLFPAASKEADDALEAHLEQLFSDARVPSGTTPPLQKTGGAAAIVVPRNAPVLAAPSRAAPRPKPESRVNVRWALALAALLVAVTVLATALLKPFAPIEVSMESPPLVAQSNSKVVVTSHANVTPSVALPTALPPRAGEAAVAKDNVPTPAPTDPQPLLISRAGSTPEPLRGNGAENAADDQINVGFSSATSTTSLGATTSPEPTSTVAPTFTPEPRPTLVLPRPTEAEQPTMISSPDTILRPLQPTATPPPPTSPPPRAIPSRLVIPDIGLDAPVIEVGLEELLIEGQRATSWAVPSFFAAGWHHSSASLGQAGNTVLNGHQFGFGGVFRNLEALQAQAEIIVYSDESAFRYRVAERHVLEEEGQPLAVRAQNASWILPTDDERLTLVTCAPFAATSHRLILVAYPERHLQTIAP